MSIQQQYPKSYIFPKRAITMSLSISLQKTQKTPHGEITKAKRLRHKY